MRAFKLPQRVPFHGTLKEFAEQYEACETYWYIQKARALNDQTVEAVRRILEILFEEFLTTPWTQNTQGTLLKRLTDEGVLGPYVDGGKKADRNALVRINMKLLGLLGLAWVQEDQYITITDAGLDLMSAEDPRRVVEAQVSKYQYPNPDVEAGASYVYQFRGLLPHLFLLQVLQRVGHTLTYDEHELFLNLAKKQTDLKHIVAFVEAWRGLSERQKKHVLDWCEPSKRHTTIRQNGSYQRSFLCYPEYLSVDPNEAVIRSASKNAVEHAIDRLARKLQVPVFSTKEDWFAYYGDPDQKPSWFTFLCNEIQKADTGEEGKEVFEKHAIEVEHLTEEEKGQLLDRVVEKQIEALYATCLGKIEEGLQLVKRQCATPIGRIDLLCRAQFGKGPYVVIEVKRAEADDAVFGQVLRYIGWIHLHKEGARGNVRGIILAGSFPDKARYSRVGLMREDHEKFLQFKKHELKVETV